MFIMRRFGCVLLVMSQKVSSSVLNSPANVPWKFSHPNLACLVRDELVIHKNFISCVEEENLVKELDSHLSRHKFESSHWDYAITQYREIERTHWIDTNRPVIQRLKDFTASTVRHNSIKGLPVDQLVLPSVHVLDLAENGEIRAHVDSVRFCGGSIAVVSLLSDSVLRLAVAPPQEVVALPADQPNLRDLTLPPDGWLDVFIPRRSVYVLLGGTRSLRFLMEDGVVRPTTLRSLVRPVSPLSRLNQNPLPLINPESHLTHRPTNPRSRSRSPVLASAVHLADRDSYTGGERDGEVRRIIVRRSAPDPDPPFGGPVHDKLSAQKDHEDVRRDDQPRPVRPARHHKIDRSETCPILVRLSYSLNGRHHSLSEYDKGKFPENELQINTWIDCSLKELAEEVRDACPSARRRGSRLHFAVIYPDQRGTYRRRELGVVISGFTNSQQAEPVDADNPNQTQRAFHLTDDSAITLLSKRFHMSEGLPRLPTKRLRAVLNASANGS
ncbi:unnamed protein product [Dicrocoelium dendriticum]|nr:unnamed protein product [Dicrocoelium dendriticum]